MSIEELILLGVALLVSVVLVTTSIDHTTPFNKRTKFNQICNNYHQVAIQKGYLDAAAVNAFTSELQARGLTVTVMNVPRTKLEWGTAFTFEVQATYKQKELQINFSKVDKEYQMAYKHDSKAMCEE